MSKILFLDDCVDRTRKFLDCYPKAITTSASRCMLSLLESPEFKGNLKYLFLDHDLEGGVQGYIKRINTGMDVVDHLVAHPQPIQQIVVHSHNDEASVIMLDKLLKAGYWTIWCPFWILLPQLETASRLGLN